MQNLKLGSRIKSLRTAKKITLSVLAERVGVTISTVSAYENSTRNPSYDVLIKLARIFNVTVDYLLGFDNHDMIDVSVLTPEQRNNVEEIIKIYSFKNAYNKFYQEFYKKNDKKLEDLY